MPDPGRRERLGHADRDDQDAAAIGAIGRLDLEPVAVGRLDAARRRPAAAVADGDVRAFREGDEVGLHLRPGREVRAAVHQPRLEGPRRRVLGQQAVPVVALVGARSARDRRVRLGPRQQTLEERPAAEHAARRRIGRDDRVLDAERAQRRRDLERTGPAADDERRVVARREGRVLGVLSSAIGSPPAVGGPGPGASAT